MDFMQKLTAVARDIEKEKGDFVLYALVQREEGSGLWDVIVSASWFSDDDKETLEYIVGKIQEKLTPREMMMLSRIVPFPPDDPRVDEIKKLAQQSTTHGSVEFIHVTNATVAGMPVSNVHVVTAA